MRVWSQADADLFNELWAGASFDINLAVLERCSDWSEAGQEAMAYMIVEQLAIRYGIIEDAEEKKR